MNNANLCHADTLLLWLKTQLTIALEDVSRKEGDLKVAREKVEGVTYWLREAHGRVDWLEQQIADCYAATAEALKEPMPADPAPADGEPL